MESLGQRGILFLQISNRVYNGKFDYITDNIYITIGNLDSMRLDDYIYYKIYKSVEYVSKPPFWSDAKATFALIVLELFLLSSGLMYYRAFFDPQTLIVKQKLTWVIMLGLLIIPNSYRYYNKDYYKEVIKKYDSLPKEKNLRGSIWVTIIILLVITNFFIAVNLKWE